MSGRRRRKRRLGDVDLMKVGEQLYDRHHDHIERGFMICGNSGVWARRDGGFTVRLVYRNRKGDVTVTFTTRAVRG